MRAHKQMNTIKHDGSNLLDIPDRISNVLVLNSLQFIDRLIQ